MGDNPAGKLLRNAEGVAYWAAAAPVLARLPAALGYRIACWRGDLLFRCQAGKRAELARNVRLVLGDELSPAAAQQVVRDWFRLLSCSTVDVKRLRRGARPLRRLVEIRGQEHLGGGTGGGQGSHPVLRPLRPAAPSGRWRPSSSAPNESCARGSRQTALCLATAPLGPAGEVP